MSRFTAEPLTLVEYTRADGRAIMRGRRVLKQLVKPLTYEVGEIGSGELIVVPDTFVTDLASVPRLFWTLFPADGKWEKAAVIHDYLCATKGLNGRYTSKRVHQIFLEAMTVLGVSKTDRLCIYTAVATFGPKW